MKKVTAILGLVLISVTTNAGNFSVSTERDGSKMIICKMDYSSKITAFHAMGIKYGDPYPTSPVLKDAIAGTKVLVDDAEVTSATPAITTNGYQRFYVPQDEYTMTMLQPDGSKLVFPILIYNGTPCVLNYDELKTALAK